jgi:hypothetical protein
MQKVRHFFPGGNTSKGFVSFYNEILKKDSVGKLAVIKGGPGTGKSSFMKKIGGILEADGELVDYLHCSSDTNSLDGIYLPKYNSALIDGTAPHIVDARYPASSDIVLNFCDFIDENEMRKGSNEIAKMNVKISSYFNEAYCYLAAAGKISELMELRSIKSIDKNEIVNMAYNISKRLSEYPKNGTVKNFFVSAITPNGVKNYLDYAFLDKFVIKIDCNVGDVGYILLQKIIEFCNNNSTDMEIFYCPIKPDKPEHIIFPQAHLAITIGNQYHNYESADEIVYFNDFCNADYDNSEEQIIFDDLITKAIMKLNQAKLLHDDLEVFYIKNVDFEKIKLIEARAITFLKG